jgi:hypothetical protein
MGKLSTLALAAGAAALPFVMCAPLDSFLAPVDGIYGANADLVTPLNNSDPIACASLCLSNSECVSFNICGDRCGISAWNASLVQASGPCSWYRRSIPRNDTRIVQAVPWLLQVPTANVSITGGPLATGFDENLNHYLKTRDPQDMLHFFAMRATNQTNVGQCYGWGGWIEGSETGNFLMGAGGALRWVDDAQLRNNTAQVVNGIAQYASQDGWIFAFNESAISYDNLPDYCKSWVVRGLLDAHGAGIENALETARIGVSYFNNHTQLPFFLPQNGGPNPILPFPSGFNNVTRGGYGQPSGHMIYIEYQGMISHTLMALTEVGTQADIDIISDHYSEQWWLKALLANDTFNGIHHRQFFSHNYEITAYEAYLDMYVLTGNTTYLQAMRNAWAMLREQWILPSGSITLNENDYYPPSSYYIGFTGTHVSAKHDHAPVYKNDEDDPYFHSPCMLQPGETAHDHHHGDEPYRGPLQRLREPAMAKDETLTGPNDSDPPTGELCGSVFWTKFNQRFHRLYPDDEIYVWEMERSIINIGLAAQALPGSGGQGPNGTGIRYFANHHKTKQYGSMHASCCEGQGTRLFGSLPEYLYTYATDAATGLVSSLYLDLYADSTISVPVSGGIATLTQSTQWPYGTSVSLKLNMPAAGLLDLALRMPEWVAAPSVQVTVNGQAWSQAGAPASYLHIKQNWNAGANTISYELPMTFAAFNYTGYSQLPPYTRWGFKYGPVMLAAQGTWDSTVDALVMPQSANLDPSNPSAWMVPAGDGNSLHFSVTGAPGVTFKPYFEIQTGEPNFDVFVCF